MKVFTGSDVHTDCHKDVHIDVLGSIPSELELQVIRGFLLFPNRTKKKYVNRIFPSKDQSPRADGQNDLAGNTKQKITVKIKRPGQASQHKAV